MNARVYITTVCREEIAVLLSPGGRLIPGIGPAMLADLQRTLDRVTRFPEAYPLVRPRYRLARLPRFPYGVVYTHEPGAEVVVVAVLPTDHQRFEPKQKAVGADSALGPAVNARRSRGTSNVGP